MLARLVDDDLEGAHVVLEVDAGDAVRARLVVDRTHLRTRIIRESHKMQILTTPPRRPSEHCRRARKRFLRLKKGWKKIKIRFIRFKSISVVDPIVVQGHRYFRSVHQLRLFRAWEQRVYHMACML